MPVVPMREILDRAFAERYGVAAINVVDDLTLEAVLAAATELRVAADRPDVAEDGQVDRRASPSTRSGAPARTPCPSR